MTKTTKTPVKTPPEHKDKLGRLITVGDFVAYPSYNSLEFGRVVKLNAKMVGVWPAVNASKWRSKNTNKYPADLVRLDEKDMTWYILRNTK
jgi:hypothetical protein